MCASWQIATSISTPPIPSRRWRWTCCWARRAGGASPLATPQKFLSQHGNVAMRVLAFKQPPPSPTTQTDFFALGMANGGGVVRGAAPPMPADDKPAAALEAIDADSLQGVAPQQQQGQVDALAQNLEEGELA